ESNGSALSKLGKRHSKQSSTGTASSAKDRTSTNSNNESVARSSTTAPLLPTPVQGSATRGTFADDASEAIVNLKIADSPPPTNNTVQFPSINEQLNGENGQPVRQLAESDTDSDGEAPLANIAALAAQRLSMAYNSNGNNNGNGMQPQMQQQMQQRSSMAVPGYGGQMPMQQQMMPNTQSFYGGNPAMAMNQMGQMYPGMQQQQQQQPFMYSQQDPNQMIMMGAGGNMQMQGPGSLHGRPTTYMDANGGMNMWNQQQLQQQGMMGMNMGMEPVGGPLLTVEKKVDPIERPTGLVGAIATREQMKSEQKYRDSSSLMRERQMRRNQAMNMTNSMFGQPGVVGGRIGGGGAFPSMYGAPQGWADDNMSMMSGGSGRAPYMQMAPSLSAEQLGAPNMRSTMYGGGMQMGGVGMMGMNNMGMNQMGMNGMGMNGMMGAVGGADADDNVALSTYAANNARMSMAGAGDMHPLRATMQSRMSLSSPHLATMNSQAQQQMMLQQQLQMQQLSMMQNPIIPAAEQQRRMSIASIGAGAGVGVVSAPPMPRSHTYNTITSASGPFNVVNSRHSLASSASGSGGSSSGSSPLAMQSRVPASRWVKESSNLRIQTKAQSNGSDMRASTMPRPRGATNGSSNSTARANITSVYELPGRSSNRTPEKTSSFARPGASRARGANYAARFENESESDDDSGSGSSEDEGTRSRKTPKELKKFFNLFVDRCLDVKPYAWLDLPVAFDAYNNFCSRNGLHGDGVANKSQFQNLMESAEWQLKTKDNGIRAYYNACLV
ncbi:hypothetical protein EV175_005891, partial [Coemansia sp. RSA 1933]